MGKRMTITLDDGYRAMAADVAREAEAQEWGNALIADLADISNQVRHCPGLPLIQTDQE